MKRSPSRTLGLNSVSVLAYSGRPQRGAGRAALLLSAATACWFAPLPAAAQFPTIPSNPLGDYVINATTDLPPLTGGATTLNSVVVTVADTTGLVAGDAISGTNIPSGARIVSVDSGTQLTLSANASATGTGLTLTASHRVTLAVPGTTEINSVLCSDTANRIVDIGAGSTLRVGAAGSIRREPSPNSLNRLTVYGGTITAGGGANTVGSILLKATGSSSANGAGRDSIGLHVDAAITDNGAGAVTVIKEGNQMVALSVVNAYSGGTTNKSGYLRCIPGSLGYGDVYALGVTGATADTSPGIYLYAAGDYTNNFFVSGWGSDLYKSHLDGRGAIWLVNGANLTGTVTLMGNTRITTRTSTGTVSGRITGAYDLQFGSNHNAAQGTLTLSNHGNDWTGTTDIRTYGSAGGSTITILLGNDEVIPNGPGKGRVDIVADNIGAATLNLNGHNETINGLNSVGATAQGASRRSITTGVAGDVTFTLGDGDANGSFYGQIVNGSGKLHLTKIGSGTQVLSGVSSHAGATVVNGGTLLVSGSLTGTSNVVVNAGGTFAYTGAGALDRYVTLHGGTFRHSTSNASGYQRTLTFTEGRLSGTNWLGNLSGLTVNAGRTVAPGDVVGTAYTGAQTWSGGGTLEVELNDAAGAEGTNWDLLSVSGTLDISGLTPADPFTVKLVSLTAPGVGGLAQNFDPKQAYAWPIATVGSLTGGFSPTLFNVDVSGFANPAAGNFRVDRDGTTLLLTYSLTSGTVLLVR